MLEQTGFSAELFIKHQGKPTVRVYFYFILFYLKYNNPNVILSQWDMAEQVEDRFPIVSSSDGFGKDHGDVDHLYFGAMLHLILLTYGIGDYYCFKACTVDVSNGQARIDSVSQDRINSGGSS